MVDSEYCRKWAIFTLSVIPNRISAKILNSGVSSLPALGTMVFSGDKSALKSATKFGNKLRIVLSKFLLNSAKSSSVFSEDLRKETTLLISSLFAILRALFLKLSI